MTNYEKIKTKTIDEMATFLCQGDRTCEGCRGEKEPLFCIAERQRITEWLDKEAST